LTRPNVWSEFGIPPWQHQLIQQLTSRTRTLVASLGIQEVLRHYPQAAVHLTTFSDSVVSQMALVERLLQPVGMA
jgi:hypothetical protein